MKLRYLREIKEKAKESLTNPTKISKKKAKFNLDSDSDADNGGDIYFTHKGRKLGDFEDDFKERIEVSDDEEDVNKGKLSAEYVENMNFGGG